jgi:hypothetical protein
VAVCLALGAAWLAGADGASALVGCQNARGKLRLRPEACKAPKERVAFDAGSDPTGVWRWASGPPLPGTLDTFTEYVVLAQDGSGRLHRRKRSAGTLDCRPLGYARSLSATLTVDAYGGEGAELWRGRLTGPDALELSDASGALTRFERASAVDAAFECVELAETRRFSGLPAPSSFTGLAFDGAQLWYTAGDGELVQPVDPASGTAGTPLDIGPAFNQVHALQGGDFWTHCACGNIGETWRVSPAGALVDEVTPGPGLGGELSISAIARDDAGALLWLYGYSFEDQVRRLLSVRSDLEPDELAASVEVGFYVNALTWDGTALWGLSGPRLYRIDPVAGLVTATYELPDDSVDWRGAAAVNGEIFVIGRSGAEGVLVSVAP